jgi:hypothetical protein
MSIHCPQTSHKYYGVWGVGPQSESTKHHFDFGDDIVISVPVWLDLARQSFQASKVYIRKFNSIIPILLDILGNLDSQRQPKHDFDIIKTVFREFQHFPAGIGL